MRKKSVHASGTSARTDGIIENSSIYPLVLSVSKGGRRFFLTTTEFAEIGESFNQITLFTPRPEPVLSYVEGRLRGAVSEP
jgi:hypothetical protein